MSLLTLAFLVAPAIVLPSPGAVRLRCAASGSACRLAPQVQMQEGDQGGGERQRGRTAVVQRPKAEPKEMSKEDVSNEPMWRLLIHNDDVHTWDYVIFAIVSVVQNVSRKKAHRITTTVHTMGSATVTITWKQQAKKYCLELQKWGLTSSIAPESSNEGGGGDGGGGGSGSD